MRRVRSWFAEVLLFAFFVTLMGANAHAQKLNPAWHGIWKSANGELLTITSKQLTWRAGALTQHALWDPDDAQRNSNVPMDDPESLGAFNYTYADNDGKKQRYTVDPLDLLKDFGTMIEIAKQPDVTFEFRDSKGSIAAARAIRPGKYAVVLLDFGSPCDLNGAEMIVDGSTLLMFYRGRYSYWARTFRKIG